MAGAERRFTVVDGVVLMGDGLRMECVNEAIGPTDKRVGISG